MYLASVFLPLSCLELENPHEVPLAVNAPTSARPPTVRPVRETPLDRRRRRAHERVARGRARAFDANRVRARLSSPQVARAARSRRRHRGPAHPLSPLRGNVAERPWRFRGITCSGCSRARPAWAAGRSAADSLPWAPRRSRTSRGTSRCRVRARARRPDGEKYFYARHANPKSSSIRRVRRRESDRRLAVRPHPRAARESLSPARETRNAKRETRKAKRVVLTPRGPSPLLP
jgi:hypothetical protein